MYITSSSELRVFGPLLDSLRASNQREYTYLRLAPLAGHDPTDVKASPASSVEIVGSHTQQPLSPSVVPLMMCLELPHIMVIVVGDRYDRSLSKITRQCSIVFFMNQLRLHHQIAC